MKKGYPMPSLSEILSYSCQLQHDLSCVGCGGDHLSTACPHKNATKLPRPPPKCTNCDLPHPSSYKGCENVPIKPELKKSYAEATSDNKTSKGTTMKVPKPEKLTKNLE